MRFWDQPAAMPGIVRRRRDPGAHGNHDRDQDEETARHDASIINGGATDTLARRRSCLRYTMTQLARMRLKAIARPAVRNFKQPAVTCLLERVPEAKSDKLALNSGDELRIDYPAWDRATH